MSLRRSASSWKSAVVFSTALAGCGDAAMSDETPEPEVVEQKAGELLSGSKAITSTSSTFWQSEAASVIGADKREYVGYNQGGVAESFVNTNVAKPTAGLGPTDFANYEDRISCQGTSRAGYSVRATDGTWTQHTMPAPVAYPLLWGDPALASLGNTIFYSVVAVPHDRLLATSNWTHPTSLRRCLRFSEQPGSTFYRGMTETQAITAACIGRGTGGSLTIDPAKGCFRQGNDIFDGGAMTSTSSFVYAAYHNATRKRTMVYRATETGTFTAIASPPLTSKVGHPLLVTLAPSVYLIETTPDAFYLSEYKETTNTWNGPHKIVTSRVDGDVALVGGKPIRGRGYDAKVIFNSFAPPSLLLVFQRQNAGFTQLYRASCTIGPGTTCLDSETGGTALTSAVRDSFMPAIAQTSRIPSIGAFPQFTTYISWQNSFNSTVRLRYGKLVGDQFTHEYGPGQAQTPCAMLPDYWGDYDTMYVRNNSTATPSLQRALTDSTAGSCTQYDYRATHQHVSLMGLPPLL
jgi:hypothetical protein